MKTLTLSIVIPVFNESRHIDACLQSVAAQLMPPTEVIVVDNNCTDDTIEKAKKFPFVKVVNEPIQGRSHARNKGFNSAAGDIIGRIDADTRLEKDWVQNVKRAFDDPLVMAITGPANTHTISETRGIYTTLWSSLYLIAAGAYFRVPILWGSNMALRRESWWLVKDSVCLDDKLVHEDQDISIQLAIHRQKAKFVRDVLVTSSEQSFHHFAKLNEYIKRAYTSRQYNLEKYKDYYVKSYTHSALYKIAILLPLSIFGALFYVSSFIYWIFSPIGSRLRKR
jgi:glycosyltransferase involved in cell wall biosynthesis